MSEKEIQSLIDRSVQAGKEEQRKSMMKKITVGVAISILSVSIITFFSSFYGVTKAVDEIDSQIITFKDNTEKELKTINKKVEEIEDKCDEMTEFKQTTQTKISEMEKDINFNHNTNFTQEGKIHTLEGKMTRSGTKTGKN